MRALVFIVVLGSTAYGNKRILGGQDAVIQDYKYQVSLELLGHHYCGGSLIKLNVVVTTAHCVEILQAFPTHLSIRAGTSIAETGGETLPIREIRQYTRFHPKGMDYDISLIILDGKFTLSDAIGTINLVGRGVDISAGTTSDVTGWGTTKEGGHTHERLQVVTLPNIDRETCKIIFPKNSITSRMSCWGFTQGGNNACLGDDGSPLVIYDNAGNPQLAGIVSLVSDCTTNGHPGVYTDLSNIEMHDFVTNYSFD